MLIAMIESNIKLVVIPEEKLDLLLNGVTQIQQQLEAITGTQSQREGYYTSSEVRKILGISQKTWQTYRDERRIPFFYFGRKIYVKITDLNEFIESHKINSRN